MHVLGKSIQPLCFPWRVANAGFWLVLSFGLSMMADVYSFCPSSSMYACRTDVLPRLDESELLFSSFSKMTPRTRKNELKMGLRDFLSRRKGKGDENKDKKDDKSNVQPNKKNNIFPPSAAGSERKTPPTKTADIPIARKAPLTTKSTPAPVPAPQKPATTSQTKMPANKGPVRMGVDPSTGELDVLSRYGEETVQQRINRVKAGKMTDEEKAAFLQSALSSGNTAESRKPISYRSDKTKERTPASPFPKDAIYRDFARGPGSKPITPQSMAELDSQQKKKQYLDMVTNPHRFDTLRISGQGVIAEGNFDSADPPLDEDMDINTNIGPVNGTSNIEDGKRPSQDVVVKKDNVDFNFNDAANNIQNAVYNALPQNADLGARLGAAALAQERIDSENRQKRREERERLMEAKRKEADRRAAELQRMRQEEQLRRESSILGRKKAEEEAVNREKERKRQAEKQRQDQLLKAQEDYWARKIASEKDAKAKVPVKDATKDEQQLPKTNSEVEQIVVKTSGPTDGPGAEAQTSSTQPQPSEQSKSNQFNPVDSTVNLNESEGNESADDEKDMFMEVMGLPPLGYNEPSNSAEFQAQQRRKKAQLDREREERLAQLNSLSSPLPKNREGSKKPQPAPFLSNFRPQFPVSSSPQRPSSTLGSLSQTISNIGNTNRPLATNASAAKSNQQGGETKLNLSELTRKRPSSAAASNTEKKVGVKSGGSSTASDGGGDSSIRMKLPLNGVSKKGEAKPATTQQQNKRKGPIRMALPLGSNGNNSDDEDDDNLMGKSPGMTIAEILKRNKSGGKNEGQDDRSKKWGIDMSRFQD